MNQWHKKIASWKMGRNLYLSIPFTWLLPEARKQAQNFKGKVFAGGPAVDLMPEYLINVADIETPCPVSPLEFHNPLATFTSRGCPNQCGFCAVPKIEGDLREIDIFPIRPVICDNNFLATSRHHFNKVIDRLKSLPCCDFNQGLDARIFNSSHASRFAELQNPYIRFAFDDIQYETLVHHAIKTAQNAGLKNISCYVLFGYKDTPDEAKYKLEKVRSWGAMPNPQRYQPLNATEKNKYIDKNWTEKELLKINKYYSRLVWYGHIPYHDFNYKIEPKDEQTELFQCQT